MSPTTEYSGGCLCGTVRFAFIPPTLFSAHCHCRYCRRAHGAAFVTWAGVPEDRFRITRGEDRVTWFASSRQGQRGFCSQCGTTLFYRSSVCPGEVHVALACMDGKIDREPELHVFYDEHVDWVSVRDDLPKLSGDSELLENFKQVEPTSSN
jgi:hypothetical protein